MLLEVSSSNPRYLIDQLGAPVILSGFHTWAGVHDISDSDPPAAFDWDEFLAALLSYGCNFTKLWTRETPRGWADDSGYWSLPDRYVRTGPGTDNDGKSKFDLTQINQDWLDSLYAKAYECYTNGIYVCVQLFEGWQIENKGWSGAPATYHPYELANNINSVDGDQNNDSQLTETHLDTAANVVWSYQTALIEAVIDRLNSLPNVIWEVSNEDTGSTDDTDWQNDVIDYIHTYEAGKPLQHPVVMTWQYPSGSNTNLDNSNADIVSYGANDSSPLTDPFTPTTSNMFDTDHCGGMTDTFAWMWLAFCRGNGGLWYMDYWEGASWTGPDTRSNPTYQLIRSNLGYLVTLAGLLNDLLGMTSQGSLSSAGYCLAKDHATAGEYVCYYNGSSTFTLDLSTATGTLNIRWLRCSDGTVQDSATVSGGAVRTLTPPWTGAVVAYVRHI